MIPYMTETFGNPSSIHFYGRQTRHAVDEARRACARSIHANRMKLYLRVVVRKLII